MQATTTQIAKQIEIICQWVTKYSHHLAIQQDWTGKVSADNGHLMNVSDKVNYHPIISSCHSKHLPYHPGSFPYTLGG